ncbi:hypothetical protein PISL3812_03225 [Talaromyces islandicus]|uniref:tRNA(Phe) 7-[(3-amino-3-carboxypropyl)-4-demethylwyosine(37)-N(4)]-methyltransferase n=1 Tax=Talaromyces islandicus TaxID=28573 RepID=A0A0U1LSW8_TALIS|nr:hypothetical protein PISL3812_03225 [Talaromyces islandicus]
MTVGMLQSIPPAFAARKSKILSDLSVPDAEYTDLSPKGSVDEGIRDLIRDINGLEGLVTTSSCAGRTSVFVEGSKKNKSKTAVSDQQDDSAVQPAGDAAVRAGQEQRKFAVSGGKGEGRWLFVSHDPVSPDSSEALAGRPVSYHALFGLEPGDGIPRTTASESENGVRLVRFHYDPMILHVMAATLHHAHPVLTAASNAGFRESGLQSLRCLETTPENSSQASSADSSTPSPIVAVRSSGLSFESVIGYYEETPDGGESIMRSLVTEEYLKMLVALANERFVVNKSRVERFRAKLLELYAAASSPTANSKSRKPPGWEDPQVRREKKRAEGLQRKVEAVRQKALKDSDEAEVDINLDF